MTDTRQDPDELLAKIRREEGRASRGRLKIFFGASAGVGKTFAMLSAAHELRSQSVDLVAPLNDIRELPGQFSWHPVTGAAGYRLRLMEVDRRELWSSVVAGTAVAVPVEVQGRIRAGTVVLWEVSARDASGAEVANSGFRQLRVASR